MLKKYKNAGFTYLNQRRNTTHTSLNILVVKAHANVSNSNWKPKSSTNTENNNLPRSFKVIPWTKQCNKKYGQI